MNDKPLANVQAARGTDIASAPAIPHPLRGQAARTLRRPAPRRRRFEKLSILIPAFNEEATLNTCVAAVPEAPLPAGLARAIIVVDDASTDATYAVSRK